MSLLPPPTSQLSTMCRSTTVAAAWPASSVTAASIVPHAMIWKLVFTLFPPQVTSDVTPRCEYTRPRARPKAARPVRHGHSSFASLAVEDAGEDELPLKLANEPVFPRSCGLQLTLCADSSI